MDRLLVPEGPVWRRGPAFVLLLAMATTLLFGPDRRYFYSIRGLEEIRDLGDYNRVSLHNGVTMNHMKVACNLALEHNFLGFYQLTLTRDGKLTYEPYNRFPVGGHVLIKLVTLPFSDDLAASLRAARVLMQTFFAGALVLAYLSLSRLTAQPWAAIGATLLAFASHPVLFWHDMVATEGSIDLFGMMLVFHGIAVFSAPSVGERKGPVPLHASVGFGQLLAKTCMALLLGWYVYALLLPFVILGPTGALARRWKGQGDWAAVRRHLILGIVALGFGMMVLGGNFVREYFALGGERPLADLPSVRSMLERTSIDAFASGRDWTWAWTVPRWLEQSRRVGDAFVPATLSIFLPGGRFLAVLGLCVSLSLVGLLCLRVHPTRLPLAALALSGFCWALLMARVVHGHEFFGTFYICVPLVFFSLVSLHLKARKSPCLRPDGCGPGRLRRVWTARPLGWAVTALTVFAVSGWVVGEDKREAQALEMERALTADLNAIRSLVKNKVVFLPRIWLRPPLWSGPKWDARLMYSLTGSVVIRKSREFADFVVAPRFEGAGSLTPENQYLFLYRPADVDAVYLFYERLAQT